MEKSKGPCTDICAHGELPKSSQEVFRVIDDGTCVLTTMDARKALLKLIELGDKHDVTACWAENEILK